MKFYSLLIVSFFFSVILSAQSKSVIAANGLLKRIAPSYAGKIVFEEINSNNNKDVFELQTRQSKLFIRGNNSNSMAVGLNYFLKNYCNTSVSWYLKDKIFLPAKMPAVDKIIHQEARIQNRFFLNYCTFGYTVLWWKWNDWEHFIDWMALNGINLPLAITGEEYVWKKVWKKFGLSDDEIKNFFTGPAYLPWHRMANIDKWEGPLPDSWLNNQLELQKKIVERERALGMKPVLPAFAGHVPEVIKTKFPHAKISRLGWVDFDKQYQTYFLDPFDSLFYPIQKEFLTEQTKLFGTDHIYGADPFNEMTPPSWDTGYLANAAKVIYHSMASVDADAQWLQMGWLFYNNQKKWTNDRIKAYLHAVPQNKMILLDYYCDNTEIWKRTESFFGQPYVWCYLGNFGGNTMLSGNMKEVEQRLENTFNSGGKNLWGLGSTLEGFGINPIIYEYVFDKAWSNGSVDVDAWVNSWAKRRYGKADENVMKAWNILLNTAYTERVVSGGATLTNSRPVLKGFYSGWTTDPAYHYDNKKLLQAWQLLNSANEKNTDVYSYDVVTVGTQVLGNYFKDVRDEFAKSFAAKDLKQLIFYGNKMTAIINDMDELLSTSKNLLVGDWIETAKTFAANEDEKKYYEQNARKIITVWGQKGRALTDYANRSIAGLMKDYYGGRWKMFIDEIINCAKNNKAYDEKTFQNKLGDFEEHWTESHNTYSSTPKGNSLEVSKKLFAKYSAEINDGL